MIQTKLNDKYIYYIYDGMKQKGEYNKLTYQKLYSKIDGNKLIVMTIYVLWSTNNNVINNAITNTNDTSTNNTKSNVNNNNNNSNTYEDQKYKNCIKYLNDNNMNQCRIDLEDNTYMDMELYEGKSNRDDYFKLDYYVNQKMFFKIIVVIHPNDNYSLEIACDKDNSQIKTWNAGDMRFKLLKTFFIEIRKFLYYLKITTKLKSMCNLYSTKKEILFSIERSSKFDTTIENELFIKFLDIGFHSIRNNRHYKCLLF